jgi:hypothetical protein
LVQASGVLHCVSQQQPFAGFKSPIPDR